MSLFLTGFEVVCRGEWHLLVHYLSTGSLGLGVGVGQVISGLQFLR